MIERIIKFIKTDIWRIRLRNVSRVKSFFVKQLRIILLAFRGFDEDQCSLRASSLTFYTLLSIVPVVAFAFGISKGFGLESLLQNQLLEKFQGQEQIIQKVIDFAQSLLENTKGGVIAGVGLLILFWTVIKVLGNIEKSFNHIWGIKKHRSIGRKFSDYVSMILICPILLIMASSITVLISTHIKLFVQRIDLLGSVSPVIFAVLKMIPYCVLWILFSFIYIFMPNTKVKWSSGILAGIVAGTVYQIVQIFYLRFQIGVTKFNAIYGSFAALPLFVVWVQLSWLIVLFGAEISFAHQNVDTYEFEPDCLNVSHSFKQLLGLFIVCELIKRFRDRKNPWSAPEISHFLEIPIRLVRQILFEMVECGILAEVRTQRSDEPSYQPGHSIDTLTLQNVLDSWGKCGTDDIPVAKMKDLDKIKEQLEVLDVAVKKSPGNVLLKDI